MSPSGPATPPSTSVDAFAAVRMVDAFDAGRRARAAADAAEIRLLAAAAAVVARPVGASPERARRAELDRRALVADLATSTRVSEWTITRLLTEATDLTGRFPAAVDALEAGLISRQHLSVIHDLGTPITDDNARDQFVQLALTRAATLTPGRLAPILRVLAERHLDQTLSDRTTAAVARRGVEVIDLPDNLATLTLTNHATLIHGIHDRLTSQAHTAIANRTTDIGDAVDGDDSLGRRDAGDTDDDEVLADTRTLDQLRADIATDMLLTAGPNECVAGSGLDAIHATVQVTIPVLTMTGTTTDPCLLAGYGPIDPDTARALAGRTPAWERVMTSPVTGSVLAVDRYRPGPALTRFLTARDEHCRFPGCRRAARRCDIDHTTDAAHGGLTCHGNLAHLCRRHHTLKHHTAWTVRQTTPGVLVWTSPTGRAHTDRPEPTVRFTPDEEVLARRRIMNEPWLFTDPPDTPVPTAPF